MKARAYWSTLQARWQQWREEYYDDNPVVWLLRVAPLLPGSTRGSSGEKSHDAQGAEASAALADAMQLQQPWHRPRGKLAMFEDVVVSLLWLAAGLAVVAAAYYTATAPSHTAVPSSYHAALVSPRRYVSTLTASMFALQAIGVLVAMPLLRLARLESAILPTGTLYAGMAHLRGSHLMYGAILETLRFVGQNLVKYGIPIFLLLGLYATASVGHSVWFALLASLYMLALSSLLVWTNLRSHLHQALGSRTVSLAGCLLVVVFSLAVAVGIAFVSVMVSPQGTIPLPSNPLAWLGTLVWWLSLVPPLLPIYTLFVEFHPLWGVPQITLMAWVSYLCVRGGALELEQFRRLYEQTASQTRAEEKVGEWG